MSHDQKPNRVRLLGSADTPQRRRGDTAPVIVDGTPGGAKQAAGGGAGSGGGMMLALIFIMGCAIGGAALASVGL